MCVMRTAEYVVFTPCPAGAAGAEDVHAQIRFLDLDFDVVARVGDHIHRGKGSVAASRRVKGRNTDEAVDAALPFEEAIYVLAGNTQAHALDPGFVAGQELQLSYGKPCELRQRRYMRWSIAPVRASVPPARGGFREASA